MTCVCIEPCGIICGQMRVSLLTEQLSRKLYHRAKARHEIKCRKTFYEWHGERAGMARRKSRDGTAKVPGRHGEDARYAGRKPDIIGTAKVPGWLKEMRKETFYHV